MKRSVNEYDENRGGGYRIPEYTGKKADNTMSNIAMGMGVPAGAALVAGRVGQGAREAAQREKDEAAKRESDAEMKRESRGVQKPANFDAIEEAKRDAQDRKAAKLQEKAYNESLTTESKKRGGSIKSAKYMSFSKTGKPAGMKTATKMSSGGKTASSRADGCCTKGKTRGKMY